MHTEKSQVNRIFICTIMYLAIWFAVLSLYPEDWAGWLLALVFGHMGVAVACKAFGLRFGMLLAGAIVIRFVLILVSSYYDTHFAGGGDFFEFHSSASQIAGSKLMDIKGGSDFFRHTLATAYYFIGSSYFSAHVLSLASFICSFFVLIFIFKNIYPNKDPFFALAIYSLLPSQIFFGTMPLREQHQILLVMMLVWAALAYLTNPRLKTMIGIAFVGAILALSHKAFSVISVALIGVTILTPLFFGVLQRSLKKAHFVIALFAIGGLFVGVYILLHSGFSGMAPLSNLVSGGVDSYVRKTWTLNTDARASYQFYFDLETAGGILLSSIKASLYYLFYPFPWAVDTSLKSLYGFFEVLLRMTFIAASIFAVYKSEGETRSKITIVMIFYAVFVCIWSLGTINYGTSIRHNLTHQWIILIVGAPFLVDLIQDRVVGLMPRVYGEST